MDLVVKVDRFPHEGETIMGRDFVQYPGGKGANQASAVALQGVETTLWGCVGQDAYGDILLQHLARYNVQPCIEQLEAYTGLAMIETDKHGKNRIVVAPGANGLFSVERATGQIDILDSCDAVVLQFEIPLATVEYIVVESKKRGKTVIVNPAPAVEVSDALLQNTDYFMPNEHELAMITGQATTDMDGVKKAVEILHKRGAHAVIVTLGENGSYFSKPGHAEIVPGIRVQAVDTTGAGDAFVGGFAAALLKNYDDIQALRHANAVAALSVTKHGAFGSAGNWDEAKKFLKNS